MPTKSKKPCYGDKNRTVAIGECSKPSVTVDMVVFTIGGSPTSLRVLLIRRGKDPYKGKLALPGGFLNINESVETAASRELYEETGLNLCCETLEQFHIFSKPDRDPRGRVISVAFWVLIPPDVAATAKAGDDAAELEWINFSFPTMPGFSCPTMPEFDSPLGLPEKLAFDHNAILEMAIQKASESLEERFSQERYRQSVQS